MASGEPDHLGEGPRGSYPPGDAGGQPASLRARLNGLDRRGERAHRPFGELEGRRYALLATFRKSGRPVPTPVWFSLVRDRVCVFTDVESGKVKRLHNDPRATLSPCNFRGKPVGEAVPAEARILDGSEGEIVDRELREKYGWQYRAFRLALWSVGKSARVAYLELRPLTHGIRGRPASSSPEDGGDQLRDGS